MKQTELIIFLVVVAINGGIALWKKMKEREAAAQAAKGQPRPAQRTPATAPSRTEIDSRIRARAEARKAPRRVSAHPSVAPSRPAVVPVPPAPAAAAVAPARPPVAHAAAPAVARAAFPTSAEGMRRALLASEVLGPPRSLRPWATEARG